MMYLGQDAIGIATALNKNIPQLWSIDEYVPAISSSTHTIPHSLHTKPDMVILIPENLKGVGQSNVQCLLGHNGANTNLSEFPYRLINNYMNTSGTWDYTANTTQMGWNADENNVYIYISNSTVISTKKLYCISIKSQGGDT